MSRRGGRGFRVLGLATALLGQLAALQTAPSRASPAAPAADLAAYVNPFVGTADAGGDSGRGDRAGMTFPGAVLPFGMMQWSPDTVRSAGGGYKYEDHRLRGFSMTHISGPGCTGAQDFPVLPISGRVRRSPATHGDDYVQTFGHERERAAPGYYDVTLDSRVRAELTASMRGGIGRFTFPTGRPGTILVNVTGSINGVTDAEATISGTTVSGWAKTGGFCGTESKYYVYFHATFDQPFQSYGTWKNGSVRAADNGVEGRSPPRVRQRSVKVHGRLPAGGQPVPTEQPDIADVNVKGPGSGVYLEFDTSVARSVQMRVGLSYVSVDGARRNLAAEIGERDFDEVVAGARRIWNRRLGQITVAGGTNDQLRTFYTALYHAFLQPYVFDDVDGTYTGFDYRTRRVRPGHHHYATFSGWDVYRSEVQLLALLAPDVASDIAQSMYDDARALGDVWDRWSHQNTVTGVMNGDPYHSIVASIHAFGARDFDADGALAAMVRGANRVGEDPGTGYTERPGNADYLRLGYVPGDVSATLEYNIADFGIAQLAARLGATGTYRGFMRRAQGWQYLYNPISGWVQPRFADGSFLTPFDPTDSRWYVEGNGAQYHWMVPHNVRTLFAVMGGDARVVPRLDGFFTELNAGVDEPYAWLGNQPSLLSPWLYAWAGAPYKTQAVVQRARALFKPTPDGLVGNDDLGTLSAWYVWASLGMFPAIPGRAELIVNGPAFPSILIRRSSGQTITIRAPGASAANPYVRALAVNGRRTGRSWLPERFVASGGRLDYALGPSPDADFGRDPRQRPPSFAEGETAFLSAVDPGLPTAKPGEAFIATLRVQAVGQGDVVGWLAKPPPGITVVPRGGTLGVDDAGRTDQRLMVSVSKDVAPGVYSVPFELGSTRGVSVAPAGLRLSVRPGNPADS